MRREWLLIFLLGLIIFISGCVKEKPKEIQFKNDVITIENYVVSDLAPYASTDQRANTVEINFDLKNNGDKPVKWLEVNFFDTPGFELIPACSKEQGYEPSPDDGDCVCIDNSKCGDLVRTEESKEGSLECGEFGNPIPDSADERSCIFGSKKSSLIDPLDTRTVKFRLKTPKGISSPTPLTVSFSIKYRYGSILQQNNYFFSGERSAIIPIVDPNFRKEPIFKFSQSDSTVGPIVLDIVPSLERKKTVDGKTITEYWGTVGTPFQTKFVMKKVVSEGTLKDISSDQTPTSSGCKAKTESCIEIQLTNLKVSSTGRCDFNEKNAFTSRKIVNERNNTLVCVFEPTQQSGFASEFTGTITIFYNYDFEIVKKQNFVIYPAIS